MYQRSATAVIRKGYQLYFGWKISELNKTWNSHICCNTCARNLRKWLNRRRKCMPVSVSMIWKEPTYYKQWLLVLQDSSSWERFAKKKKKFYCAISKHFISTWRTTSSSEWNIYGILTFFAIGFPCIIIINLLKLINTSF